MLYNKWFSRDIMLKFTLYFIYISSKIKLLRTNGLEEFRLYARIKFIYSIIYKEYLYLETTFHHLNLNCIWPSVSSMNKFTRLGLISFVLCCSGCNSYAHNVNSKTLLLTKLCQSLIARDAPRQTMSIPHCTERSSPNYVSPSLHGTRLTKLCQSLIARDDMIFWNWFVLPLAFFQQISTA